MYIKHIYIFYVELQGENYVYRICAVFHFLFLSLSKIHFTRDSIMQDAIETGSGLLLSSLFLFKKVNLS